MASTLGNVLEWYDFVVFGFLSITIAKQFFPSDSEYAALMLTTATFGAGFVVRPLGGILLGMYADRKGRKAGLTLVIAMMTVAAAMIALTPGFQQIGLIAPAIVLCASAARHFGRRRIRHRDRDVDRIRAQSAPQSVWQLADVRAGVGRVARGRHGQRAHASVHA
ncbi:MFS transporter [Paraburkholderia sp. WC7.3b]|uniref:MFS transporter n=1 Tax=Paraburkholderia podalyriae TaxID=1938811 RepID=A0ABR7PHJ2_9BURK|nr:MFS transporter [Paraburkholderia podalyriae]